MSVHVKNLTDELKKEIARAERTFELSKEAFEYYREAYYGAKEDFQNSEQYLLLLRSSLRSIEQLESSLYGE